MAVFRVDVLVDDPQPVFDWIVDHIPEIFVVRTVGYNTLKGCYVKSVFKRQGDAELFHQRWYPDITNHTVLPFGKRDRSTSP
jgi:hypothetical protein